MTAALMALLLAQTFYSPSEAQALFQEANQAYANADYTRAKDTYRKLVDRGMGTAEVLFNLGTTHLAAGELGPAVLYLERARRAGMTGEAFSDQLAIARTRQVDRVVGGLPEDGLAQRFSDATSATVVSWLFALTWCGGLLVLLVHRAVPRLRRRRVLWTGLALLALAIPSGLLVLAHVRVASDNSDAVVMAPALPARELPGESGKVSFEVHAGLKVRMREAQGAYVRIRLPNGLEGWARRDGLEAI
jgi:hypothetical protein